MNKSYLVNFTETASDTTLVELELLKDELKGENCLLNNILVQK